MKIGDTVIYKGRKWIWADTIKDKAYIVLLPGQKKIIKGIEEINSLKTNPKNLILGD